MKVRLLTVLAAFIALCTFASFASESIFVFGISCSIIALGVLLSRPVIGLFGLFILCVHATFAAEYKTVSDESSLIAATVLVTFAIMALVHVIITSGETRRFDWRVFRPGIIVVIASVFVVAHSIVILTSMGTVGTFLGDIEATGAQVVVLAFATAILLALLLIPPTDVASNQSA